MTGVCLEVCVDSVESAVHAVQNGADRLLVCAALPLGGVTPGIQLFRAVWQRAGVPTGALIRPRTGDFCYTQEEFHIMKQEAALFRDAGASFFSFGILNAEGSLDVPRMDEMMLCLNGARTVLNRAFDFCRKPQETARQVKMLGMHGLTTSGQEKNCFEGRQLLAQLVLQEPELEIIAAGDCAPRQLRAAAQVAGTGSFQLTALKKTGVPLRYRGKVGALGMPEWREWSFYRADGAYIAAAKRALCGLEL